MYIVDVTFWLPWSCLSVVLIAQYWQGGQRRLVCLSRVVKQWLKSSPATKVILIKVKVTVHSHLWVLVCTYVHISYCCKSCIHLKYASYIYTHARWVLNSVIKHLQSTWILEELGRAINPPIFILEMFCKYKLLCIVVAFLSNFQTTYTYNIKCTHTV